MLGNSLEEVIHKIKPDIVHSMEIQHAGYRALAAKQRMGSSFPTWIMSNWGSDIYLYHRIAEHQDRVKEVLESCDYYACECERDVELAKQLGLKGKVLPVLPCGGGFDIERLYQLRQPGPTSQRKIILLKGYQHWAGRALVGLRAIELCADEIRERGYKILIPLASPDVLIAAELVAHSTGIPIEIAPHGDYMDAMRRFGAARIHIGLSISDGISQSLIESMVMGAFPIQSCTACANEWIEDGKSGFIVPPEDPHIIAAALRRAVTEDDLVDQAVRINDETARQRLSYAHVQAQAVDIYKSVFAASRHKSQS
jgi:glycosyltransferase involved in cell wall biosynthesis